MKRNRRSHSETFEFLREKMELDKENRKMEYEEKQNQNNLIMAVSSRKPTTNVHATTNVGHNEISCRKKKRKLNSYLLFVDKIFT